MWLARKIKREVAFAAIRAAVATDIADALYGCDYASPTAESVTAFATIYAELEHRTFYGHYPEWYKGACLVCRRLQGSPRVSILDARVRADAQRGAYANIVPFHGGILRGKRATGFLIDDITP